MVAFTRELNGYGVNPAIANLNLHFPAKPRTVEEGSIAQSRMDQCSTSNGGQAQNTHKDADSDKAAVIRNDPEITTATEVPTGREDNGSSESNSISTLKRVGETHLIVAALVATVTFTAGFSLPGGHKDDGMATLAKRAAFRAFVVADTLAMVSSVSAALVYFFTAGYEKEEILRKHLTLAFYLTMFSMQAMVVAFLTGMCVVLPHSWLPYSVCVLCGSPFLVLCCVFVHFQTS